MDEIKIDILNIDPVPKGRPRFSGFGRFPRVYTPSATKNFETIVRMKMRASYAGPPLETALFVSVVFYIKKPKTSKNTFPKCKPDLDNFLKAVLDAGNGILWKDDAQICEVHSSKAYSETVFIKAGAIIITVREVGQTAT